MDETTGIALLKTYIEAISAITRACNITMHQTNRYPYINPAGPPLSNALYRVLDDGAASAFGPLSHEEKDVY